ncbi:Organic cation transporter protein, partial [Pseudolycoriella hygida]
CAPNDISPLDSIERTVTTTSLKRFTFPKTNTRAFQLGWLDRFQWLEYSVSRDAAYCFVCRQFDVVGTKELAFKVNGFSKWKRALEKNAGFVKHEQAVTHKSAMISWDERKTRTANNNGISELVSNTVLQKRRFYMKTMIEILIFLITNEVAIRGSWDIENHKEDYVFRNLFEFEISHNKELRKCAEFMSKNETYLSPDIQNELIWTIAKITQMKRRFHDNTDILIAISDANDLCYEKLKPLQKINIKLPPKEELLVAETYMERKKAAFEEERKKNNNDGFLTRFKLLEELYVLIRAKDNEAAAGSGVYATAFILAVELMQPNKRVIGGTIIACNYTLGEIVLGLIAMFVPNYRTLLHITYTPLLLIISYFWIIPESIRWLLVKGRKAEAVTVILKAVKMNKIILSVQTMDKLRYIEDIKVLKEPRSEINKRYAITEVFKSRILLIRLANCCLCWITNAFVYYGLSLNSVTLAGDKYTNFILVCTAEIPGYIITIFVLNKFGRKYSLCASMLLCGTACLASEYVPVGQPVLRLIMFLIGKCTITVSFTVLYVLTTEMYPTNLRNSLVCVCSMIGRIGSMAAPQTPLLGEYMAALPLILFGGLSIISGLLSLMFPETLNTILPDTVKEAEDIGKNNQRN